MISFLFDLSRTKIKFRPLEVVSHYREAEEPQLQVDANESHLFSLGRNIHKS